MENATLDHLHSKIREIFRLAKEMEDIFPGRPFTPDGHMVGSIGECLVARDFDLELMPPSTKGFDAKTPNGRMVEIKATRGKSVAFRECPDYAIVIVIDKDGHYAVCYNGPGSHFRNIFNRTSRPSNGQFKIQINTLRKLNDSVADVDRVMKRLHITSRSN